MSFRFEDEHGNRIHVDPGTGSDEGEFAYFYISDWDGVANVDVPKEQIRELIDFLTEVISK